MQPEKASSHLAATNEKTFMRRPTQLKLLIGALLLTTLAGGRSLQAQHSKANQKLKVIIDTDIGDDIDDAFALALAVSNPKLQVIGVTTAWGDTELRARLTERFLKVTGHADIPVAVGPKTHASSTFSQARWAEVEPVPANGFPDAIDFTLDAIRHNPGQITLIAIAPFSNIGALIDKDPNTFSRLKQIVLMGGSVRRGYGDLGYLPDRGAEPEYNVMMDIPSSRKLFASGVPIEMMPLDSTQLKLDETMRDTIFSQATPMTDALLSLYEEWHASTGTATPTLFDAMAVAAAIDPDLCPTRPMAIQIDDKGFTRTDNGGPNADVCLQSDSDQFFHFYIPAILAGPHR
jgi:purine nucleosidase